MEKQQVYEHWVGMPEYNNKKAQEPAIEVLFKFKNQEDFERFNILLKKHVFKVKKVFDGKQTKTKKQAWFPFLEKGTVYEYR